MSLKLALPGVLTVVQHSKLRARLRDPLDSCVFLVSVSHSAPLA